MVLRVIVIGVLLSALALAAAPVGYVDAVAPVQIGRVTVGGPVVPVWLVMAGDRITTNSSSTTLSLKSGAVYIIPAHSTVILSALGIPVRSSGLAPVLSTPAPTLNVAAVPMAVSPILPPPKNPGTPPSKRR